MGIPKSQHRTDCSIDNCERPHYGKSYCRLHWERWKRNGNPLEALVMVGASVEERIERYSQTQGNHVVWTGHRDKNGYGQMTVNKKTKHVHRLVYELAYGPIGEDLVVRHKCDYPPCLKLDHLELGTHWDNQQDKVVRGRSSYGARNSGAKVGPDEVLLIRSFYAQGAHQKDIAALFGLGQTQVGRIVRGESWGYLKEGRDAA